eukprot:240228_1
MNKNSSLKEIQIPFNPQYADSIVKFVRKYKSNFNQYLWSINVGITERFPRGVDFSDFTRLFSRLNDQDLDDILEDPVIKQKMKVKGYDKSTLMEVARNPDQMKKCAIVMEKSSNHSTHLFNSDGNFCVIS